MGAIAEEHSDSHPKKSWKISQVADLTGVSKELIHHYLRQGLLPPSSARARYDERQIRLLILIKRLRDEHTLPLEVIRGFFEIFDFNPDSMEPLVLAESLSQRLIRLAEDRDLGLSRTLSLAELAQVTSTHVERLGEYAAQKLITPLDDSAQPEYSAYDANVVSLCERGVDLGMSFESFRTIASYVRIAFELEHAEFFDLGDSSALSREDTSSALFLRREIVSGFVQNVYQSLVQSYLRDVLDLPGPKRTTLDTVVYRPSQAFVEKHRIDTALESATERVARDHATPSQWRLAGELFLHAGRYREATLFLEQSLDRWPADGALRTLYGVGLVLSGEAHRGHLELEAVAAAPGATASSRIALALALFSGTGSALPEPRAGASPTVQSRWSRALALIEAALAQVSRGPERFLVNTYGGWLLTALPPAFRDLERGRDILVSTLAELETRADLDLTRLPGLRERCLLNASYLLFECFARKPELSAAHAALENEDLSVRICRLDPGCFFAHEVFLADSPRKENRTDDRSTDEEVS